MQQIMKILTTGGLTLFLFTSLMGLTQAATAEDFVMVEASDVKLINLKKMMEEAKAEAEANAGDATESSNEEEQEVPFEYALLVATSGQPLLMPIAVFVKDDNGEVVGRYDRLALPTINQMIKKQEKRGRLIYLNPSKDAVVLYVKQSELVLNPENEHQALLKELIESNPDRVHLEELDEHIRTDEPMSEEVRSSMYL